MTLFIQQSIKKEQIVLCHYCNVQSELVTGKKIYPHRKDLYKLTFWMCKECSAYVGTHKDSNNKPLGILANDELRKAKRSAHSDFDPLWRDGHIKRKEAYRLLSQFLEITSSECHIGMFCIDRCRLVNEFVSQYWDSMPFSDIQGCNSNLNKDLKPLESIFGNINSCLSNVDEADRRNIEVPNKW